MPRKIRTFNEIERGVHLRFEGKTFLEIAKMITQENFEKLLKDGDITKGDYIALNEINWLREHNQTNKSTLEEMEPYLPNSIPVNDFSMKIVSARRLQHLATSQQWTEYETTYHRIESERRARQASEMA